MQSSNTVQGRRHVQNLIYRVPRASVVAVCSTEAHELEWARAFEEYKEFNVTVYDSYEAMLSHPGLQAVWISTSTDVHASQTMGAIKKGLHVLCEKPLSTKMDEVRAQAFDQASPLLRTDFLFCIIRTTSSNRYKLTTDRRSRQRRQSQPPPQGHGRLLTPLRRLVS